MQRKDIERAREIERQLEATDHLLKKADQGDVLVYVGKANHGMEVVKLSPEFNRVIVRNAKATLGMRKQMLLKELEAL